MGLKNPLHGSHNSLSRVSKSPSPDQREPQIVSSSGRLQPGITSRACRWGCECSRSRWRWSRTRCTCWRRGRGGACAWASECTPIRSLTSRTIRSASRRRGVHASALVNGCNQSHSSCCRNIYISCSCCFPLNAQNYPQKGFFTNINAKLNAETDSIMPLVQAVLGNRHRLRQDESPTYFEFLDLGGRSLSLRPLPILVIAMFMLARG